ncbi:MAG: CdaR family protein [Bacillota bacterium]|nr:CdaR family protein [Bacillota bacterium]
MDKLMDNPWFIKIIALLLAFLLYSSVPQTSNKLINVPGNQTIATITDVPVKAYYDTDNLVVLGIPNTVKVQVKGPVSLVQPAKVLKDFEVYVDLKNAKIGNQKVKFHINNLSDKLKAEVVPATVNVSVQEKVTKEFRVSAEFNNNLIADGFAAGTPIIEPDKVKITGAKDVVDRIGYVKAAVNLKQPPNATITKYAQIRVLDRDLNRLDVQVEPDTVKVTIPIKNTSKTVPINIIQKGTPPSGVSIDSISLDAKEATVAGNDTALKATDHVRVEVDVSNITDDTTQTLPVIIPNGITKVTPQMVTATIKVKKAGQKTVSNLPIKTKGLSNQYKVQFNDPASQMVNLLVTGSTGAVTSIGPNDFSPYIDVSNLTEGDYDLTIQIDGPSDVNWKPDKSNAKITITKSNV